MVKWKKRGTKINQDFFFLKMYKYFFVCTIGTSKYLQKGTQSVYFIVGVF